MCSIIADSECEQKLFVGFEELLFCSELRSVADHIDVRTPWEEQQMLFPLLTHLSKCEFYP